MATLSQEPKWDVASSAASTLMILILILGPVEAFWPIRMHYVLQPWTWHGITAHGGVTQHHASQTDILTILVAPYATKKPQPPGLDLISLWTHTMEGFRVLRVSATLCSRARCCANELSSHLHYADNPRVMWWNSPHGVMLSWFWILHIRNLFDKRLSRVFTREPEFLRLLTLATAKQLLFWRFASSLLFARWWKWSTRFTKICQCWSETLLFCEAEGNLEVYVALFDRCLQACVPVFCSAACQLRQDAAAWQQKREARLIRWAPHWHRWDLFE